MIKKTYKTAKTVKDSLVIIEFETSDGEIIPIVLPKVLADQVN